MSPHPLVDAMHTVLDLVAQHGLIRTLLNLHFAFMAHNASSFLDPLPRTLTAASSCLSRLKIKLPLNVLTTLVFFIVVSVARDLCNLTHFHFVMDGTASQVDVQTIAPCTKFAHKGRILCNVKLDIIQTRLTDMAVALLLNIAVERHQANKLNQTSLKFEGVSADKHTLQALYTNMTCIRFSYPFLPFHVGRIGKHSEHMLSVVNKQFC